MIQIYQPQVGEEELNAIKNVFDTARSSLETNNTAAKLKSNDFDQISDIIYNDKYTSIVSDINIDPNRIFENRT